jgi:hypothetical protein
MSEITADSCLASCLTTTSGNQGTANDLNTRETDVMVQILAIKVEKGQARDFLRGRPPGLRSSSNTCQGKREDE